MEFSINGLSTDPQHRTKLNGPPTPYKIKVKNCKLMDLVIKIEYSSNFNATILEFSENFDHPFSHVFIFGNLFPESHGFVAMPVTGCIKDTCSNLSLCN